VLKGVGDVTLPPKRVEPVADTAPKGVPLVPLEVDDDVVNAVAVPKPLGAIVLSVPFAGTSKRLGAAVGIGGCVTAVATASTAGLLDAPNKLGAADGIGG
jgi:hypothetical protein